MFARLDRCRRPAAMALSSVLLLAGSAACTTDESGGPASAPSSPASTGTGATLDAKPVPLQVKVTRVSGKLNKKQRTSLESTVGRAISGYFDAAFLAGEYPRSNFSKAFATFSKGAARQARRDRTLLTNARLGATTRAVAPKESKAWLSVLAPNKVAAGVSARFRLVFVADRGDARDQEVTMSGRLMLTRAKAGGWQIFGYDVARSAVPSKNGATS